MFSNGKKIRLLYLGVNKRHTSDLYRLKGFFQQDYEVWFLDFRELWAQGKQILRDSIIHALHSFDPHAVLVNKGEKFTANLIDEIKSFFPNIPWLLFYGDIREDVQPWLCSTLNSYNALLINAKDKEYWNMFKQAGAKRIFYHHTAADTEIFIKDPEIDEYFDIGFFGGNYYGKFPNSVMRYDLISSLMHRYKMLIYGSNWGRTGKTAVYHREYAREASSCKILLGLSNFNEVGLYTSNRTWNSMAVGFVIHQYFKGIENLFHNKKHLVWFKKPNELFYYIDYYLDKPDVRNTIYKNGRKLIIREHTYKKRAEELTGIIKKLRGE
ncbi:MAG: glycosyltransferase family protein [Candidatus Hodarchaeales archaeon]